MSDIIVQIAVEGEIDIFVYQVRESTSSPSGSVAWDEVTGKPSTFAPSAHDHSIDDITGLNEALDARAVKVDVDTQLEAKADLVSGVIPTNQIPAIAISEFLDDVNSQAAMLALNGQRGDWAIRTDLNRTAFLVGDNASILSNWRFLETPGSPVISVNGQVGVVVLGKADIGLPNVDNTSDANKPVSIAQAAAIAAKANVSHSHAISDVTGLPAALDGKMPITKLWPIITSPQSNLTAGLIRWQNVGASGTPLSSHGTADGTVPHAMTVYRMRSRVVTASPVAGSPATAQLFVNGVSVATVQVPIGASTGTFEAVIAEPIVIPDNATWFMRYDAPSGSAIQFNNVTLSVS